MKPPFDIAGDLDTPVSAFMKLKAFKPSFLLESVEGGERLGRYSFIGFGDALELRLSELGRPRPVSRVLLLRSAPSTRQAVILAEDLFAAAFPARMSDAVEALRDPSRPWPGAALLWMSVAGGEARLLHRPPPGIRIGR